MRFCIAVTITGVPAKKAVMRPIVSAIKSWVKTTPNLFFLMNLYNSSHCGRSKKFLKENIFRSTSPLKSFFPKNDVGRENNVATETSNSSLFIELAKLTVSFSTPPKPRSFIRNRILILLVIIEEKQICCC